MGKEGGEKGSEGTTLGQEQCASRHGCARPGLILAHQNQLELRTLFVVNDADSFPRTPRKDHLEDDSALVFFVGNREESIENTLLSGIVLHNQNVYRSQVRDLRRHLKVVACHRREDLVHGMKVRLKAPFIAPSGRLLIASYIAVGRFLRAVVIQK